MDRERLSRARVAMERAGLDALVCRLPENVLLLCGHWPLNGMSFLLYPQGGTPLLIVPHCDEREARDEVWEAECVTYRFGVLGSADPYEEIGRHLVRTVAERRWRRVGYEGSFETVAPPWNAAEPAVSASVTAAMLESVFGDGRLVDATALLMDLRARKTPGEVDRLRIVNEIAALGLAAFRDAVDTGRCGVELVAAVERAVMVEGTGHRGAKRVRAFAQVSCGPEETAVGYRPMEISTTRKLRDGEVALLELAVVADGFWSDRTRPRVAGTPGERVLEMHRTVLEAQEAAIAAVGPGVLTGAVDAAARGIVHRAGFTDEEFLHVTGHGLGFRYHEPVPLVLPGGEVELASGMVHTVEPGVYEQRTGGIRIEDNVVVTDTGAEVMGAFEKSLVG